MNKHDPYRIALLLGKQEPSLLKDYLDQVANQALLQYRRFMQWGNKKGESLYTHVLNGILVLETLRSHLELSDVETRILFTAFTVHDLNKITEEKGAFTKLASKENIAAEIERLGLDRFFPTWQEYLEDMKSLILGHSGHAHSGGDRLFVKHANQYGLDLKRVNSLLHLMRAADIIDLSHTLEEKDHKSAFVGYLNAFLADSGQDRQYEFITHRLTDQRGLLSNVLHNAIAEEMENQHKLIPLLYYPDGIVYLQQRGQTLDLGEAIIFKIARRATASINQITRDKFADFIVPKPGGIKVDAKCLELGVPFAGEGGIWNEIYNIVQRKNLDPTILDEKTRERTARELDKNRSGKPKIRRAG